MRIFNTLLLLLLSTFTFNLSAQIISKFTWDDPTLNVKKADVGPNASSTSSSSTISANGVGGTAGLNPGNPKMDIEMIFSANSIFDIDDVDLSVDYQRDESQGTFFKRGSKFEFLKAKHVFVKYTVKPSNGGSDIVVNSGNIQEIPGDDNFRNYRFTYNPIDGIGRVYIDGVELWSHDGPDNHILSWDSNDDIMIGELIDGAGANKPVYDNYVLQRFNPSTLPIELLDFSLKENELKSNVKLNWTTATETNNNYFTIERSKMGLTWNPIGKIKGAGNSQEILNYSFTDLLPQNGISYYRLKQTDFDGKFSYSPILSCNLKVNKSFMFYPNPSKEGQAITLRSKFPIESSIKIFNMQGVLIKEVLPSIEKSKLKLYFQLPAGSYFLEVNHEFKKWIIQ